MKKFLTCALCFMPSIAGAVTLYYTPGRECPGLYLNSAEIGCPADSLRVTQLSVTSRADADFTGYNVGNVEIVDSTGNIKSNAVETLAAAAASGNTVSKVTGNYECVTGATENKNGVCVYGLTTSTQDYTYVDFTNGDIENGYEVLPDNLIGGTKGESCMHSKFKVRIHWCPPKHGAYTGNWGNGKTGWNPPTVPAGFDYPELWPADCENGDLYEDLEYEWKDRQNASVSCYDAINNVCKGTVDNNGNCRCAVYKKNNVILEQLNVPTGKFADWTLRGFYLGSSNLYTPPSGCSEGTNQPYNSDCFDYWGNRNYFAKWRVTTKNNTDGMARLGLPKNSTATGYIPLNDGELANWANTRWGVWDCSKTDEQVANTTYHLYAGWARNCENDKTCTLTIKRTGLHELNDKGDAFYTASCSDGSQPQNAGTYNPTCNSASTISYTYSKYQTTDGTAVTCAGVPSGGTCTVGTNFTLASPTSLNCSGGNYAFYKWSTSGGTYDAGASIPCTYAELGAYTGANITGILCDCDNPSGSAADGCNTVCDGTTGGKGPTDLQPAFTVDDDITEQP